MWVGYRHARLMLCRPMILGCIQAASLHQSLTDASVDDIDVRDVLAVVSGGSFNGVESHGRGNLAAALAAAAVAGEVRDRGGAGGRDRSGAGGRDRGGAGGRDRGDAGDVRARVGKRRGGVSGDRRSLGGGRGRTASSSEDSGALVLRTIARRPLKEMMRYVLWT